MNLEQHQQHVQTVIGVTRSFSGGGQPFRPAKIQSFTANIFSCQGGPTSTLLGFLNGINGNALVPYENTFILLNINYNDSPHHMGKSQICAGDGVYFRPSNTHSGNLWGHSAKNNTGHFRSSLVEELANKGPKSISCHLESSIMIIYIISQHLGSSRFYLGQF